MANKEKEILEQQGEESAENAFDEAVKFWSEADEKDGSEEDTFSADTEDDDPEQDTEDGPEQDDDSSDDDTDVTDEDDDDEEADDADYKVLYERRSRELDDIQKRLQETEQRFRSWQGRAEASNAPAKQEKKQVDDIMKSEEMKNLLEYYPDLVDPVQKLIAQQVKSNTDALREEVQALMQQQVAPLAQHIYQTEAQAHEAAILSAHPDLKKHIDNGAFEAWVSKLPPYQQAGAYYTIRQGSAQEVIDLFSDYKNSSKKASKDVPQNPSKDSKANTKSSKDDDIVSRVKDGMRVKSQRSDIKLDNTDKEDPKKLFEEFSRKVMKEDSF